MPQLALLRSSPMQGRSVPPETVNKYRRAYGGATPDEVSATLRELGRGYLERWGDLRDHMLRVDGKLRGLYTTRLSLAGIPWDLEEGEARDANEKALARAAVEFIRYGLSAQCDLEQSFLDSLDAIGTGVSVQEIEWVRDGNQWRWELHWCHLRRFRFVDGYRLQLWDQGTDPRDLPPSKFLIHTPRSASVYPVDAGELLPCVWPWLFKTWGFKFWVSASERFGNPLAIGKVPPNATETVRSNLRTALESLSADSVGVLEDGSAVEIVEPKADVSADVWSRLVDAFDGQMTEALLGVSMWINEPSQVGAENARIEQLEQIHHGDARRFAGSWRRDLFTPALAFNAHLFGGRMPPVPRIRFRIGEKARPIPQTLIDAGGVTYNELRRSGGLPAWSSEEGGDQRIPPKESGAQTPSTQPAQPSQPSQPVQPRQPPQPTSDRISIGE